MVVPERGGFSHERGAHVGYEPLIRERGSGHKAWIFSLSSSLLSSLELSDANVYGPQIRARLGTASHFCEVVILKFRTAPIGAALSLRNLRVTRRGAHSSPRSTNAGKGHSLPPHPKNQPPPHYNPQPPATPQHLRILVYLVIYDSGQVSLVHLLLSRHLSQRGPIKNVLKELSTRTPHRHTRTYHARVLKGVNSFKNAFKGDLYF